MRLLNCPLRFSRLQPYSDFAIETLLYYKFVCAIVSKVMYNGQSVVNVDEYTQFVSVYTFVIFLPSSHCRKTASHEAEDVYDIL